MCEQWDSNTSEHVFTGMLSELVFVHTECKLYIKDATFF